MRVGACGMVCVWGGSVGAFGCVGVGVCVRERKRGINSCKSIIVLCV